MASLPSTAIVSWPSAPLTKSLVQKALQSIDIQQSSAKPSSIQDHKLVQWSSYDEIDHELAHLHRRNVLSSSYTFRKALIRKHFLSRCILSYVTKHETSLLKNATPRTFEIEISFADELDEMWADDLWDLGKELEDVRSWWILKPGMADRGMGIRLFNSKETLQEIFEEFDDTEDEHSSDDGGTAVVTSQLRHFVIQEYISNPLLLDPSDVTLVGVQKPISLQGYKFHLRSYCVSSGALQLYLYDRILALFSAVPYTEPLENGNNLDLAPHLTNTSLQVHNGEKSVRLLEELIGCRIMSHETGLELTTVDVAGIKRQMVDILAETFKAALENPIHFQPMPNAFELYGIDFLVEHVPSPLPGTLSYQVKLLEINAEPAIELTGPRLSWILEDLFISIAKVCVKPFLHEEQPDEVNKEWYLGDTHFNLIKCLGEEVRRNGT